MKRALQLAVTVLASMLLIGCQSSGVMKLSGDTYMISKSDAGPFATLSQVRREVMKEVTEFAAKQDKIAVVVSSKSVPRSPGHVPYFEYQFRLFGRNDPRAQGVALKATPDYIVENNQNIKAEINVEGDERKRGDAVDLYAELTKLDDLRKRGLITDAEYETEKKNFSLRQSD